MPRRKPPPAKLLLVEGQDDRHVVEHVCREIAPDLAFSCKDTSGSDQLLKAIPVETKPAGRLALGILMDANNDISARWQAIGNRLRDDIQLPDLPNQPEDGGTVIHGDPRFGVWLMPDNKTLGEIEDFVAKLVPEGDPVWPLAEEFINSIPPEHRQFPQRKEMRAKLHTWLAAQREPQRMGTAIHTGALNARAPAAMQLAAWLKALFGP